MDLFDILSMDERVIVYSDLSNRQIHTWNRSLTFSVFQECEFDKWEEVHVWTLPESVHSYEDARKAVINHLANGFEYDT